LKFPIYRQLNAMDCGPTCLKMIAKYYGKNYTLQSIKNKSGYAKDGVSLLGISEAAESMGFRTRGVQITFQQLSSEVTLPCILHWSQNHFVVLPPLKQKLKFGGTIKVADPAKGLIHFSLDEFEQFWISKKDTEGNGIGIALLLEPTSVFYSQSEDRQDKFSWFYFLDYIRDSKWDVSKVFITLLISMLFQLIIPYITQSIVDKGINTRNIQFVTVILLAQLMLVFSRTVIDFIRSYVLLKISTKINFSLVSDFWIKITRLPISYFDSYHTGDTLQRLGDSKNIEQFLTGSSLNTIFSLFSFITFSVVLSTYDISLFLIFGAGSVLYFLWVNLFLKLRRKINYQTFDLYAKENNASLQLVQGMQELKLNNAENIKRWEWENIQASIFNLSFKILSFSQLQQIGAVFINEGKNVLITFMVAKMVIHGQLTMGTMLAIQYIIGQLNGPIEHFVEFIHSAQDAKISLERLTEIHNMDDEESSDKNTGVSVKELPENRSISFSNFSFTYPGVGNEPVLKNINLVIPEGKTTAIVGVSGSGKTTLLKLLLKFYDAYDGDIFVGSPYSQNNIIQPLNFKNISHSFWRRQCGSVLQNGFIFNDTIGKNISIGHEDQLEIDKQLVKACEMANILAFIESLPNGFNTKIGTDGVGISQGQEQRILIARAVYKDPYFLFFDEATNSLDANNEKVIVENMQYFFKGRTVVVIAHRLSTVKNADNIIVLHQGEIVEQGTHKALSALKGMYYGLVKNQIDLGN